MDRAPILSQEAIREVIGQVAAQHRVVIKDDDPAFFFATISAAVTERALTGATAQLRAASEQLQASADGIQRAAVSRIAEETRNSVSAVQRERQGQVTSTLVQAWPLLAIVALLALILGYVVGATT